jgi:hypothetical protein
MTQPDWNDERIAAAFRARFERPAPPTLAGVVHQAITGTSPARFGPARRAPMWGFAAAAVVVAVVAVAFGFGSLGRLVVGPSPSDTTATASADATPSALPTPTEQALPGSVFGLQIVHVSDAITVRDDGADRREMAVLGWFTSHPPIPCPAPIAPPVSPIQSRCPDDLEWLTERPESLIHQSRDGSSLTSAPTGPALHVDLDGLDRSWEPVDFGIAANGDSVPTDVVFVGHFDDPRASLCPTDEETACQDRFVVDSVGSVEGVAQPRSMLGLADTSATSSVADIEAIVANEAPQSPILSMQVVSGPDDLASSEPSLASGQNGLIDQRVLWIVRVLGTDGETTYIVVDGTDAIYELTPGGDAILVGGSPLGPTASPGSSGAPSPSPSPAPWPPAGATVIELTSAVGTGDLPAQVAVVDKSGRLRAVAENSGAAPTTFPADDPGAYAEPGLPGRVHIVWTGGICDSHITVTVAADLRTITFDMGPQPDCDTIGIGRELVLDFSGSVDVPAITFVRAGANQPTPPAERGYDLDCASIAPDTCEGRAAAIVADYLNASPPKRVIAVRLSDDLCGSFGVDFDDGTSASTIIDCFIPPSPR